MNRRPALRVDDPGLHAACCGPNTWTATKGSVTVFINGKGAHRMGDQTRHCGGIGQLSEGSPNVVVGESSSGGAGGGSSSSASGGSRSGMGGAGGGTARGGAGAGSHTSAGAGNAGSNNGSNRSNAAGLSASPEEKTYVAFILIDQDGRPVARTRFKITTADGAVHEGQADDEGRARVDDVASGDCELSFPDIHRKVDKR